MKLAKHPRRRRVLALSLAVSGLAVGLTAMAASEIDADQQTALALVQKFAGQLKPRLKAAISADGPAHAVAVCATEAPQIAESLSAESGWVIRRVSSRNRNPAAVPDEWETAMLKQFEDKLAAGADPSSLSQGEVTPDGYRFAKAQVVEPLCLMCHGQTIAADVSAALASYYPNDMATGYELGQIRGIFSLIKPR
ncbi:DUF3365 domain-containing protein [Pseudomaricurvus alcaniphilus]|uniref:Tll0287-like domain-containing protein n=1 Tax=Pseudomaricurvus alcaniphilus TaxID=1166482 RepID=UPI00140B083F|nr:DUF3365 domain-containing protein [Pseudomaricurvus alcaniphilus]NHN35744.1 DUF3365 domain-containing protein [Pseudomaricurvus alcaniphilus]